MKKEYYGLENGEILGYNKGREEKYFFCIYSDGSSTVNIRTKSGRSYIYGNLSHCRKMYRAGYSFLNKDEKEYILTKKFKNALNA